MKNIIYLATLLLLFSCSSQPKQDTRESALSDKNKKQLEPIAPKKNVEPLKSSQTIKIDKPSTFENNSTSKVNSNNKFELLIDGKKSIKPSLKERTKIVSIGNNRIKFSNNWVLHYWLKDKQRLNINVGEEVYIQMKQEMISSAFFKTLKVLNKNKMPILCIISTGGNQPITSKVIDQIIIKQTEEEIKFVDNASEKINNVVALLNDKKIKNQGENDTIKLNNQFYEVLVNNSIHYYPKGNDSFESPKYVLEYTITRVK